MEQASNEGEMGNQDDVTKVSDYLPEGDKVARLGLHSSGVSLFNKRRTLLDGWGIA